MIFPSIPLGFIAKHLQSQIYFHQVKHSFIGLNIHSLYHSQNIPTCLNPYPCPRSMALSPALPLRLCHSSIWSLGILLKSSSGVEMDVRVWPCKCIKWRYSGWWFSWNMTGLLVYNGINHSIFYNQRVYHNVWLLVTGT